MATGSVPQNQAKEIDTSELPSISFVRLRAAEGTCTDCQLTRPTQHPLEPVPDSRQFAHTMVNCSVLPVSAFHRIQELLRVVADAILEDNFHFFNIRNLFRRIALDHHHIRILSRCYRADLFVPA